MEESLKEGELRFRSRLDKLKRTSKESKSVHGKLLYNNLFKPYSTAVKALQKRATGIYAREWFALQALNTKLISHLALITVLDSLSRSPKRTTLASKIGQKVNDELIFKQLKQKYPDWFRNVGKQAAKRVSYGYKRTYAVRAANLEFGEGWQQGLTEAARIHIGLSLLEALRQTTGLIEYSRLKLTKKRFQYLVLPTKKAIEWIERVNLKASKISPFYLPLKDKPLPWTSLDIGGYRFPTEVNWGFIKGRQKYDKDSDYSYIFKAANVLQSSPHRVNQWVTKVALSLGLRELKAAEDVISQQYVPSGETNCTLAYRKSQAKYHAQRLKLLPERILKSNTLKLAERYSSDTLYFPVQADFRGRLYYTPCYLNPQNSDLAKGLLEFAEATSVRGCEHWFLIGGANSYGIKGSLEERQEWAIKHEREIKRVASDPLGFRWWQEAASPYPFLAFCNEYAQWASNRITFKTHLPVRLDHHASGLQIVALLENDKELMRLTNLDSVEYPNDIYSCIKTKLKEGLQMSHRPEDYQWLSMVDRKLIKSLTVSLMYGGSFFGLERITVEWYKSKDTDVFGRKIYTEIKSLIQYYHKALNSVSETPLKFLEKTRASQGDELLSFKSPSGFTVYNDYKKYKSRRIKTTVSGEVVVARASVETPDFNRRAARQALPANKVHTYDAALLHRVLNSHEWPFIQTLHDCYCVPPSYCVKIQETVQETICCAFGVDIPQDVVYAAS